MGWIVYSFLDFFFTVLSGASAFISLYMVYQIYITQQQLEADIVAMKHPLAKIHIEIIKLKDTKRRANGQKNKED